MRKLVTVAAVMLLGASAAQAQYPAYTTLPFGAGYIHQPVPAPPPNGFVSSNPPTFTTMPLGGGYITEPVPIGSFGQGFIDGLNAFDRYR